MFAIIPFVPELIEFVVGGCGVYMWGYYKGRQKRRLGKGW
jgi:hypothetical protein